MNPLQRAWSYSPFRWGTIIASLTTVTLLILPGLHIGGYSAGRFLPHATCYLREPSLIWLNVLGDSFIALAYLSISATLGYIVYRARHDIPFHWMFAAFGLFIVACGFTHIMGVVTVWRPYYYLAGDVKAITAVASVATAVILPFTVPRVFSMIHDAKVSAQRKHQLEEANERLRASDEMKSQFFANVSHELRTPLTLIMGPLQRRLASSSIDQMERAELEVALRNAGLLLQQVNNLLDLARLDAEGMSVHYERVDVAQTARRVASYFETLAAEREVFLELDAPAALTAEIDRDKVARIFLNLLSNAFKFTPKGGVVRCSVREDEGELVMVVEDSGPGIPETQRRSVFERFHQVEGGATRSVGGTGLGLAIVREFALLHHGSVDLSDSPIGGARFEVRVPVTAPAGVEVQDAGELVELPDATPVVDELRSSVRGPEVETGRDGADHRPLVLVVEDNPDMSAFVAEVLGERYRVATARDGIQGLEGARRLRPDLIVTDIMMPHMSGDELIAELRADNDLRETPVVVLTAKADERQRVELLETGAQDHLTKPFSSEELLARVDGLVQRRRATIQKLRELNASLEQRVAERTAEVEQQAEQLRALASELSATEQRERRRFAQALHDHLQQLLVTAKFTLERVATRPNGGDTALLEQVRQALDEALQAARDLTFDLYPPVLYDRGLAAGITWLGRRAAQRHGLQVDVSADASADPEDQDLQAFLFASAQELLLNVAKHSTSDHARITLERTDGSIALTVEDDGPMPDPDALDPEIRSEGFGLFSIRERLRVLGGNLALERPQSGGLRARITVPLG